MKLIEGLKLDIGYTQVDLLNAISEKLGINVKDISKYQILKEGLDARRKPNVHYVLNVAIETDKTNSATKN